MYLSLRISSDAFASLEVELLHVSTDSEHEREFGDFIAIMVPKWAANTYEVRDMLARTVVIPARLVPLE